MWKYYLEDFRLWRFFSLWLLFLVCWYMAFYHSSREKLLTSVVKLISGTAGSSDEGQAPTQSVLLSFDL